MRKNFTTERALFCCLLMEEYGTTIQYIMEDYNGKAGDLNRVLLINSYIIEINITRGNLSERYCVDKFYSDAFSLTYLMIDKYKRKDKELVDKLKHTN